MAAEGIQYSVTDRAIAEGWPANVWAKAWDNEQDAHEAKEIDCPVCSVKAGKDCLDPPTRTGFHPERLVLAKKRALEQELREMQTTQLTAVVATLKTLLVVITERMTLSSVVANHAKSVGHGRG